MYPFYHIYLRRHEPVSPRGIRHVRYSLKNIDVFMNKSSHISIYGINHMNAEFRRTIKIDESNLEFILDHLKLGNTMSILAVDCKGDLKRQHCYLNVIVIIYLLPQTVVGHSTWFTP